MLKPHWFCIKATTEDIKSLCIPKENLRGKVHSVKLKNLPSKKVDLIKAPIRGRSLTFAAPLAFPTSLDTVHI